MKSQSTATQTIKLYLHHAWNYKFLTIGMFVSLPLAVLTLSFIPPLFIAHMLTEVSDRSFVVGDFWGSFGTEFIWYAAISLFGGIVLWRVAIIFLWSLEMRVIRDIYQTVFTHLMHQSIDFHSDRFGGSLVSQSNKFASSYIRFMDTTMFDLYTMVLSFIFSFIILYPKAPVVAFGLIGFSIVFMLIAVWATKGVRLLRAKAAEAENKQTGFLADAITNVFAIKSFAGEKYENTRFAKATEKVRSTTQDVMIASVKRETIFGFSTISINIFALFAALYSVVEYQADVAVVFLVITYTGFITQRLWEFAQHTLKDYNRAIGDSEAMTEILALKPRVQDIEFPEKSKIADGMIRFRNVTFQHAGSKQPLFDKLDIQIQAGEKVGLVGHSGSGKTSLTRLLLRFSDIDGGAIEIDGQNISRIAQSDLHASIAFVPQEPLLFHRSIRENIGYGQPGSSDETIAEVAKLAHAHEFIETLPNGYDTLVGERGVKLSGGQRQRVVIARAMLKNAPLLVLDEATSALDSQSEVLIQDALWKLMEGRTAIVIAHRLSTIQKMDRIIVLDHGKIVEQGSHKELLAKAGGTYAKLWAHQSGGFIEE